MAGLQHLVVVIPRHRGQCAGNGGRLPVWGQGLRQLATAAVDPERLDVARRLRPVGLLESIRVLPWMVVPGYRDLICQLRDEFRLGDDEVDVARDGPPTKPNASMVEFPYDFRLGVADAACRLQREVVARLGPASRVPRRVIVLAHSTSIRRSRSLRSSASPCSLGGRSGNFRA